MPLPKSNKNDTNDTIDTFRHANDNIHPFQIPTQKDKKRNLFRFGRKKSRPDFNNFGGLATATFGSPFLSSDSSSILSARKKSRDYESSIFSDLTEETIRVNERKKSGSSNQSRGYFDDLIRNDKSIELDQNFNIMDGILNPEFRRHRPSISQQGATIDQNLNSENWAPPDSWSVQPADDNIFDEIQTPAVTSTSEYFPVVEHENWNIPSKNFCIRIFRPDGTFGTLIAPLNATANELIQKLAGKFFLHEISKYRLSVTLLNQERILQSNERPIQIQKTILEQMGYTEEDKIEDIGREDNTYLFRFSFKPSISQTVQEDSESNDYKRVDLQGKNLSTVPIFLYKYATRITSLDVSKNLLMEIPTDFLQSCKNLKQLFLTNNSYYVLPSSVPSVKSLEHLNISSNQITDLQSAHLEDLSGLRTLKAYNNRLESLPESFAAFKYLTILFISNNAFTKFPKVICQITSLAYLDISFNKISSFPDEICNLTQLVGLFATANRLRGRLPSSFSKLEKLKELDLRQNQITDLDELYMLPELEVISLDYNAVTVMNFNFEKLRHLKMSKNHLTQFNINPNSLCYPDGSKKNVQWLLTELNLANCKLSSLPDDLFVNAVALEILILDNNTLSVLPSSIGSLTKLTQLSVQGNNLESLPSEISKLVELKELDAQKNNLKFLPKEIWLCPSLQTLNCSSNLLESFPEPLTIPCSGSIISTDVNSPTATQSIALPSPLSEYTIIEHSNDQDGDNVSSALLSSGLAPPPIFNPPTFFANPRNHPPPLSLSLRYLFLGDNRFTDDIWSPLSCFSELRTLNLCFNDLYEIPPEGLCHQHLYELYLSGNNLASLPADDIEKLCYLRVLAVNGNKLQTLPAEIGKLRKLLVLDVGNNVLKYNISNWPYDWNWNWNLGLKYLNLSGNKRLEIKRTHPEIHNPKEKNLSDFSALKRLRMLGLMDITILGVSIPEEFDDRRVRTSPSEVNGMSYGIADWLGPSDHLATWDLVVPRFRNRDDECLFALFDGRKHSKTGCQLTRFLNDNLTYHFINELEKTKNGDTIVSALRRTFLVLEKEFGSLDTEDKELGASAVVCYISGSKLYVANVGDALAVLSRNNGQALEISQKHIPLNPSEISRIRAAGGFVSSAGHLNDELNVSRSFGYYHLIPVVTPNPYISTIDLAENDEFVIMASRGLWDKISYQAAVDIARTEKDDLMVAAQKLRDFALTYGADDNVMVMIIGVADLFDKRDRRLRNLRLVSGRVNSIDPGLLMEEAIGSPGMITKNKRRIKDESPSDSVLARLDREVPPPTNQVALVFTDIKSSTLLWNTQTEDMRSAIKIHDQVMRRTLRSIGGYEVKTEGDAFMVCFQDTVAALLWCYTVQLQLLEVDWPAGILETDEGREIEKDELIIYRGLSVRMGIHLGTPVYERNPITKRMDYFGPVVNKASRICNAADGGQICVSSDVIAALREIPGVLDYEGDHSHNSDSMESIGSFSRNMQQLKRIGTHVVEMGERRLKGLETPEMLSLVYPKQLIGRIEVEKVDISPVVSVSTPQNEQISEPSSEDSPKLPCIDNDLIIGDLQQPPYSPRPIKNRHIDPTLVVSLHNLAMRLETISSGSSSSTVNSIYNCMNIPPGLINFNTDANSLYHQRIHESTTDEELVLLMENFVTRIENASSAIYLTKVDRFSNVLEKLGEAIELDPLHVLRALQVYAEVYDLSKK